MERGEIDIFSFVDSFNTENLLTPAKIRFLWEGMLEALKCVHDLNVIHSDIKPANFLLVNGIIKISDFGFATRLGPNQTYYLRDYIAGTKDYLSPETLSCYVIEEGVINTEETKKRNIRVYLQSDIWALGVILYQLVYGCAPYSSLPGGRIAKIQATIDTKPLEFEPIEDVDLLDTLKNCLNKNPLRRPTIDKLLRHPYLYPTHKHINKKIHAYRFPRINNR